MTLPTPKLWPAATDPMDVSLFEAAETLVVATHRNPDGDGVGAELALQRGLGRLGKTVRIINSDPVPKRYRFLDHDGSFEVAGPEHDDVIREADLLVVLDTNDLERIGRPVAQRADGAICVIDHHLGDVPAHVHQICDPDCSSTGELVYRILRRLGVTIDAAIAEPIYASILYDTASFRFIRNRAETLRVAAELLACGVDATALQEHIFMTKPRDLPKLYARSFERLRYAGGGRVVWTVVRAEDTADLDLDREALREVIMFLGGLDGVDIAFVLKEESPDGRWKLSVRSKRTVDIFPVVERRGGGGHAHAAGATVHGDLEAIAHGLLDEFDALLR